MDFTVCTIAARNYLPQARVLADTLRSTNPGRRMVVLILDDTDHQVDVDSEPFDILRPEQLGIEIAELHRMAVIYDVMELATALKPWLLETLLGGGASEVLYLDPDIAVFSSLDHLGELTASHGIALTPHTLVPFPRDNRTCSEDVVLASGIYNLGFIGVSSKAESFLSFWQDRLRRECVVDPENMRFVDQRWVDFVPGMYDHAIVREPEYNVAYWNLHGRPFTWDGSQYRVDGRPLAFFHFSGYSPKSPHLLSKHQGDRPRILLSEQPALAKICDEYACLLVERGYGSDSQVPYGLDGAANGLGLDRVIRAAYREMLKRADEDGEKEPPDPFEPGGAEALVDLLNRPFHIVGWDKLTTYLAATWWSRPDLQKVYPDPCGADSSGLLAWARNEVAEGRMDAALATVPQRANRTAGDEPPEWAPPNRLRPGAVVAGYFNAEVGVGEGGRLTSRLVEAADIPYATFTYSTTPSRQQHPFRASGEQAHDFDVNVIAVNADHLPQFAHDVGSGFFNGRYNIGQWAWELEEFPRRFWPSFDFVDEIWALSEFNLIGLASATDKPVHVVPLPVLKPVVNTAVTRRTLGLPDRFLFLFCFDLFSVLERKNPLGLIQAFKQAFAPNEGPVLVLKVINGDRRLADLETIRWQARDRPDIMIMDHYLGSAEQASLMSLVDCYVSLHRSEGFGLTMAEAMALAKPVIATGYSGNLDFMSEETAHLVSWEPGSVPPGSDPYPPGARWAEPDLEEASALMQRVAGDPAAAVALGARAQKRILSEHGVDRGAAFVRRRFDDIQRTRSLEIEINALKDRAAAMTQPAPLPPPAPPVRPTLRVRLAHLVSRVIGGSPVEPDGANPAGADHSGAGPDQPHDERTESPSIAADLRGLVSRIEESAEREKRVDALDTTVRALSSQVTMEMDGIRRRQQSVRRSLAGGGPNAPSWSVVQQSVAGLRSIPYMSGPSLSIKSDTGEKVIGFSRADRTDWVGDPTFEDVFRGTEEVVRQLLRPYVSLLSEHSPVIDFGCGHGEMLDLLADAGIDAVGVDNDKAVIERCEAKGHEVHLQDGLAFLAQAKEGSAGAVFSAQVVEHLDHDQLMEFLHQTLRVLEPGGLLIAETVNPHALHGFKTFWVDLTHRVPIFPEVLVSLCRDAGYAEARVIFPEGQDSFEEDRWTVGRYAVLARSVRLG